MRILIALCLLSFIGLGAQARPYPPPRHMPPHYPSHPHRPHRDPGECYLDRYPDICRNSPRNYCRNPWKHFQEHGRYEGRIWGCR